MSNQVTIKLGKGKLKLNDYYDRFELEVTRYKGAKIMEMINNAKNGVQIIFKPYREQRSRAANNYAWHLIGKIAEVQRTTKDFIYLMMLKDYGVIEETVCVLAEGGRYLEINEHLYVHCFEQATYDGKLFNWYHSYKGSSKYNISEMRTLIEGIVFEAQELGIDTRTPAQISQLIDDWKPEKAVA